MSPFPSGWALVTGASSGIGRAVAVALARRGMRLLLTGRDPQRLEAAASEVRALGSETRYRTADLGLDDDLRALARWGATDGVQLDVLVHSAGSIHLGDIETVGWDDLDADYRVNVRAPFLLTKLLLPLLREAGGQLVFVNSLSGLTAQPDTTVYAASKHALRSLANSLRDRLGPEGIRVLSVFPGRTTTPMLAKVLRFGGKPERPEEPLDPRDVAELIAAALALPRTAEVTELVVRPPRSPAPAG